MEACELHNGTAASGTVAHGLLVHARLALMNLCMRSNGFGDPPRLSERVLGVPDALHPIEIVCYCAVKFGLVILGLSNDLVILFWVKCPCNSWRCRADKILVSEPVRFAIGARLDACFAADWVPPETNQRMKPVVAAMW
jgi:hypothetical protein